ncbi:hypothetical protein GmHk_10G029452 [Glycine max]|nr:hypothetical protein GmHk_10G029452 [Glycine max]
MYPSLPINPSMDRESSMGTSDIQCNEKEHDTPSDFASESQIPPFFTQIDKRTKVFTYEAYSSSSNPDTLPSNDPTSPIMDRPIGTKVSNKEGCKRKNKEFFKTKSKPLEDQVEE